MICNRATILGSDWPIHTISTVQLQIQSILFLYPGKTLMETALTYLPTCPSDRVSHFIHAIEQLSASRGSVGRIEVPSIIWG